MSNSPPTTLGQYQIIREIARSNDIVYEAYDPLMNRRVAVKELAMPAGMTDAQKKDRISRFKREAQAAGTLNHPNIMTVYSFAEDAGRTFMAMEFLDGHTLRNEIDTKGFLPPERACEVAIAVLEGLSHAHAKGVIHRDIKPDNVQILSNGNVKITDFGIARLTFQPNLTMDGQVFGTPSYMSPEQVVGRDIDARSDLFSVAVLLYEMLSGQKPFAGDSVVTITYAIMNKEPQQPTQCDWALWQVINRALDKSPQLRYASAEEMVGAIRDARNQAKSGLMGSPNQTSGFNPMHPNNTPGAHTSPYANPTAGYSPIGGNTPAPPPQAPYQTPYIQQPYNPYQPAPPTPPPPPQYAYNPYQPQGSGQQLTPYGTPMPPVNQPYGMPPPGQLPIYYPPPPRPPILKPDTVIFLKKLLVAFVVLVTLVVLLCVAGNELSKAWVKSGSRDEDVRVARRIESLDPKLALDERIQQAEEWVSHLPPDNKVVAGQAVAKLLREKALSEQRSDRPNGAEVALQRALELDPTSTQNLVQMGTLYISQAQSAGVIERVKLLQEGGKAFEQAKNQTASNTPQWTQYGESAAKAYYGAATSLYQVNPEQKRDMRDLLNQARSAAPPNSQILGQIDQMFQYLSGSTSG